MFIWQLKDMVVLCIDIDIDIFGFIGNEYKIAYNFTPSSSVSMRCQVTKLPLVVASYFASLLAHTLSLVA
jgi:hypothetical protein